MALFAERGIYGTRIEDITERADIGKGAFYNYFPSKDALIADLVAEGVQTFQRLYVSRLNGASEIKVRVSELARLHGAFLDEHPEYALLFHQARGLLLLKDTRVERLREVFADYLRIVGRSLVQDQNAAAWSEQDLLDIAAAVVGGVAGYRSFRIAAALPPRESTAEEVLSSGIPGLVEERRRSPAR